MLGAAREENRASERVLPRIAANRRPKNDSPFGRWRESRFRRRFAASRVDLPSGARFSSLLSQLERAKPLPRSGWACGTSSGSEVSEGRITRALLFSWRWINNPQGRVRREGRTAGGEDARKKRDSDNLARWEPSMKTCRGAEGPGSNNRCKRRGRYLCAECAGRR